MIFLSTGRVTLRLTIGSSVKSVSQSVSQSWCRSPPRAYDKILKLFSDTAAKDRGQGGRGDRRRGSSATDQLLDCR
jgi:hypothetical protein